MHFFCFSLLITGLTLSSCKPHHQLDDPDNNSSLKAIYDSQNYLLRTKIDLHENQEHLLSFEICQITTANQSTITVNEPSCVPTLVTANLTTNTVSTAVSFTFSELLTTLSNQELKILHDIHQTSENKTNIIESKLPISLTLGWVIGISGLRYFALQTPLISTILTALASALPTYITIVGIQHFRIVMNHEKHQELTTQNPQLAQMAYNATPFIARDDLTNIDNWINQTLDNQDHHQVPSISSVLKTLVYHFNLTLPAKNINGFCLPQEQPHSFQSAAECRVFNFKTNHVINIENFQN